MNILSMIAVTIPLSIGLGYLLFFVWMNLPLAHKTTGQWVAEIWLTTNHGRGATMFRQRFESRLAALLVCKARALGLDMILPSSFWVEDEHGKPLRLPYYFGIHHEVRSFGHSESTSFQAVWHTELVNEESLRGDEVGTLRDPATVLAR